MKILFATDGSKSAEAAGRFLTQLGGLSEAHLEIVSVAPCHGFRGLFGRGRRSAEVANSPASNARREVLRAESTVMRPWFRSISTQLYAGQPDREIVEAARNTRADLIVVGHRRRSPAVQHLLGSIAQKVADRASCSVLVVPEGAMGLGRVLLAHNGSPEAESALAWVKSDVIPARSVVHVVSLPEPVSLRQSAVQAKASGAYEPWILRAEAENRDAALGFAQEAMVHLRVAGKTAYSSTAHTDGPDAILRSAGRDGADLVVIGSHARHGWKSVVGNTARLIVSRQSFATLVVRPLPVVKPPTAEAASVTRLLGSAEDPRTRSFA